MVHVEPIGNCGHLFICVRPLVWCRRPLRRAQRGAHVRFVFAVCVVAVELLYVGHQYRYELHDWKRSSSKEGVFPT